MITLKLGMPQAHIQKILITSRFYNWGNYDASSGECCRMRDKEMTMCMQTKQSCPLEYESDKCYEKPSFCENKYPKYLLEIYNRGRPDPDCLLKLIRHDSEHYKPSDKNRQYQRTWPECPFLWLKPKDVCCPNPEIYPPMKRRCRPPPEPPLSAIDKHLLQMSMLCKTLKPPCCKMGRRPPKCIITRLPADCCKKTAPQPSFSEACRHLIPRFCGSECACRVGSLCEMWKAYHRLNKSRQNCVKPLIGYSPYRSRMRFPF
ncbi:uncharacterized protein LOC108113471 [Drosophila eugracilis]|uniref:uncharacterized protein LOC108113471 n=1 Tax=Drosophila eugracilis TaxID=29029 RepID=UPI0007E7DC79|nr:uncharacterized protein LOC108113471 [Drosophila eugracilis]